MFSWTPGFALNEVRSDPLDVGLRIYPWGLKGTQAPARQTWRRFRRHYVAVAALIFLFALAVVAIFAPHVARYSSTATAGLPLQGASAKHWMGTDSLGRDLWSRVVYGSRISLEIAIGSQAIAVVLGLLIGIAAGWWGKIVDTLLMRLTDVAIALPP